MRITGTYQKLGDLNYFIPNSLPITNPELQINNEILNVYSEAIFNLGKLNEMALRVPDQNRFIKAYVIKEAMLSSAIEGINTTLIDVLGANCSSNKQEKETQLVMNYSKALYHALSLLQTDGFPISSRIILESHKVLMSSGEGDKSSPGEYRKQSVRVGELVPPPASIVPSLIGDLEQYINNDISDLPLIKAGLAHLQFETIHPFLDGNGRIGRLLIVLMIIDSGLLNVPVLYPSYYFKKHHLEYYQRLDLVRTKGDAEGWILYYLKAIRDSAFDSYKRAKEIEELELSLQAVIATEKAFFKISKTALDVLNILFQKPIISISEIAEISNKSYNTISNIISIFMSLGYIKENKQSSRSKLYIFETYIDLLEKEY